MITATHQGNTFLPIAPYEFVGDNPTSVKKIMVYKGLQL